MRYVKIVHFIFANYFLPPCAFSMQFLHVGWLKVRYLQMEPDFFVLQYSLRNSHAKSTEFIGISIIPSRIFCFLRCLHHGGRAALFAAAAAAAAATAVEVKC